MNRTALRGIAAFLVAILLLTSLPLHSIASIVSAPETSSIQNDYIKVTVDNASGRFGIRTVDGQPIRKKDGNVDLIFEGDNPESSFTTFRIDGTDFIFGNPYKLAPDWFSEVSEPAVVKNTNGTESLITVWTIKQIRISQIITLLPNDDLENAGNARVTYQVDNNTKSTVEVGARVLLDTSVGGNDGPAFQIGQNYLQPLTVERKLVHEPETLGYDKETDEQAYNLHKLPSYWVMRDKLDPSNPLATNVMAYGFNNMFEGGINIVDEMIVGHWSGLASTKWDYEPNENLDYTLNTNAYGTADSAVAYYWNPDSITAGASNTYEVVYGLGEIVEPDKVFDVRFLDPVQKLETNDAETGYENDGIFEINTEIENLAMYDMEHSQITVTLSLENGLKFVDESGQVLGATQTLDFRKDIPPEEAAKGVEVIPYKPGEIISAKWRVKAEGKPWPTTSQYLVTVSSPETEKELQSKLQEAGEEQESEIRAIYESSKANFVFLPPIGELRPTLLYSMTPDEVYDQDDKYISLNLSNISAYEPGSTETGAAANFDLYLKNTATGERYKVPVSESVTTRALGNGFSGDMRIVFRGGDLVDNNGLTIETVEANELPLGEYAVVVDFKDKSNPNIAEALSFETSETFHVTQNAEVRVRKASILAVYKAVLDLTQSGSDDSQRFAEALPASYSGLSDADFIAKRAQDKTILSEAGKAIAKAAKAVTPELRLDEAIDVSAVPVYGVRAFQSEAEFEAFETQLKKQDDSQEIVLEVRGNIVQSGTGAGAQYTVKTDPEPAIINRSVAYTGKDLSFPVGEFPLASRISANTSTPFLHTLFASGEGTLSIANSGFVFYKGEWTVDFYNGFDKTLGTGTKLSTEQQEWEAAKNPEDSTLNGSLGWANGLIGDASNPYRDLLVSYVYFNQHSLFASPSFSISGFGLQLNDYVLREDGVSFGGAVKMVIVDGEVKNVMFNEEGFVGIDASLKFELGKAIGLFKEDSKNDGGGEISITHYLDPNKYDVNNYYGIKFNAKIEHVMSIKAELAFKQVADGRILPDVIAFGSDLPDPGVSVGPATYITALRGAIRELADTIAGGDSRVPLTLEAGIDMKMGIKPAVLTGDVDLSLKMTGIKVAGSLSLGEDDEAIKLLTEAVIQMQWVSPMFLSARATIDIGGWGIIVGKTSLFIGENLEKHRTDFEGIINGRIQVPSGVPIVGGIGFGVYAGANNDKVWAGVSVLFVTVGVTYYWGGGIEFGTDGNTEGKDALMYLLVEDPELGPKVMAIGSGIDVLATSWENEESEKQEITYRSISDGVAIIDDGSQNLGIGGIVTSNGAKVHSIPMNKVSGDALLEVEYYDTKRPKLTMTRSDGSSYDIVIGDITDKNATAFEQIIKAAKEGDLKSDGTKVTKQEALASTDVRRVYIAVPESEAKTGKWTLTSDQQIRTKLMNLPVQPALTGASIEQGSDENKFTAKWTVDHATPGDTVSLYLSKDKASDVPDPDQEIDPGLLIAKDIVIKAEDIAADGTASGKLDVDAAQVSGLGGVDIRGLLPQGNYYLRAELKTETTFSVKSSAETFRIIDPLAPSEVSDVSIKAAGNGQFEVAFPQVAHKSGQENAQYGYLITAKDDKGNQYEPFGEVMYTEEQLESALQDGKYRLNIGGWSLVGKPKMDDDGNIVRDEQGNIVMEDVQDRYTGLETGLKYSVGVSTVRIPTEEDGASSNMRFAETVYSENKLLPVPSKPVLNINGDTLQNNRYDLTVKETTQHIELSSNQTGVVVEAIADDAVIGSVTLSGSGNSGKLDLKNFNTDGTYAVELRARNVNTGDYSVSMLYLTVDTTAPMIYLDTPDGGFRINGGGFELKGTTNTDATVAVTNAETGEELASIKPDAKGHFDQNVPVSSTDRVVKIRVEAIDDAGNANSAVTEVINDDLKLPKQLKLVVPDEIVTGGTSVALNAVVQYTDGSEESVDRSKLVFSVEQGDSNVRLTDDGMLTGRREGSALIRVDYKAWEGLQLSGYDVVGITPSPGQSVPTSMGVIKAATAGTGKKGETRVIIQSSGNDGNMTGSELAYKLYVDGQKAAIPLFDQDITSWKSLPSNGIIPAKDGNMIVVAKRTKDEPKLTLAASAPIRAYERVYSSGASKGTTITVGGVEIASGSSKNVQIPLMLDGVSTEGLLQADIEASNDAYKVVVKPVRDKLLEAIGSGHLTLSLPMKGAVDTLDFQLDAELVKLMQDKDVTLEIETDIGKYVLSPNAIDLAELGKQFAGSSLQDIQLTIKVAKPADSYSKLAEQFANQEGAKVVGELAEFSITANASGRTEQISQLASFVRREIPLPDGVTETDVTTAVVIGADGAVRSVPTSVQVREGMYYAQINSMTNSVYALISNSRTFKDTGKHWASDAIHDLASRFIVSGDGSGSFNPSSDMTRAEFAAILVKALGLATVKPEHSAFSDVSVNDWYYDAVHTANQYGLISGYGNGQFGPKDKTTREQAMVIIAKAMKLAGLDYELNEAEMSSLLSSFKDVGQASAWAKEGIALTVKSGIITGQKADQLAPKANMTRAELAVVIRRLLQNAGFID
ncbi:S-layer family protein [Paenibacillus cellulosilyticus]|uniref:S-layer family protein n=1 Tax=Paenibacillus cellulosilyticus TaxID=375489 RepID=A0A2V2YQ16_9BACL|nr:S-layer homology domain-containing protein [Paenibacillus cellulosilyticus]PWV98494.1 S-layer family protein [Paenibacillus cellulosilyticus]QKS44104.1 S-layer homology domain-containing protein [Paenibacillus cellulosilyticus]